MGAGVHIIEESLQYGIPQTFHIIFLLMLKISFSFKLDWLKILKDTFEEDYPIVANLFFLSILNLMSSFNR